MLSATKFNTVAILEEVPGMHYADSVRCMHYEDSVSFYQVSKS